jgi:hypothetical protein
MKVTGHWPPCKVKKLPLLRREVCLLHTHANDLFAGEGMKKPRLLT